MTLPMLKSAQAELMLASIKLSMAIRDQPDRPELVDKLEEVRAKRDAVADLIKTLEGTSDDAS